jgi:hypothetical protein
MSSRQLARDVAILAAGALVALLAADWFNAGIDYEGTAYAPLGGYSAWWALEWEPWVILGAAAVFALAILHTEARVAIAAALVAFGLVLYRLIEPFEQSVNDLTSDPAWGLWASLGMAVVMALAALALVIADRIAP